MDGRRKSVQPMAGRLDEPNDQSLRHFLADTPWDPVPVRRQLARRMDTVIGYRELKTCLGLDHYEGRKWAGWQHHVTLVAAAHGFLTWLRHRPKAPLPG